jgi:multicomponent K+:H+ antiporter subunit D
VAALFAVMTKVGLYAILRCDALVFGAGQGLLAPFMQTWLPVLALATLAVGAIGALAATSLRALTSYLVLASVGLLGVAMTMQTPAAWAAALYYLLSTTLCTAALFLLADALEPPHANGQVSMVAGTRLAGLLYLTGAVVAVGLPPLSGFLGKVMILRAVPTDSAIVYWPAILVSGLVLLVAASRTGTRLLWRLPHDGSHPSQDATVPVPPRVRSRPEGRKLACSAFLLACNVMLTAFAAPVSAYVGQAAAQLQDRAAYVRAVLPAGVAETAER